MNKTGGPAFPRPASEYTISGTLADGNDAIAEQDGMTLRDYFAGQVLGQMIGWCQTNDGWDPRNVAAGAYQLADAMLVEREKVQP